MECAASTGTRSLYRLSHQQPRPLAIFKVVYVVLAINYFLLFVVTLCNRVRRVVWIINKTFLGCILELKGYMTSF